MELWKKETQRYQERLDKLAVWNPLNPTDVENWPQMPISRTPDKSALAAMQLLIFVHGGCICRAQETAKAFLALWRDGLFSAVSLPARLIFELWGASHYALSVLEGMSDPEKVEKAAKISRRLLLGARTDVMLLFGGETGSTDEKSIHVSELIESLHDIYPEAKEVYQFISESCHPSYLRFAAWSLASPPFENWKSNTFREEAHRLLDSTLSAIERAFYGMADDAQEILNLSHRLIETG